MAKYKFETVTVLFVFVFCLLGIDLRSNNVTATTPETKTEGGDLLRQEILAIYARLDKLEQQQQQKCECCQCEDCDGSCAAKTPVELSSSSVESSPPSFEKPITIDGMTYEFSEYIANHYKRDWIYNGRRWCPASHLITHGVDPEQANRLTADERLKLHSALHEAGVKMKPYSSQSATRQQPVRVISNMRYQSYCPNGICPQR